MILQKAGITTLGIGIVLLVLSFTWTTIVPTEVVWSEAKAKEYQAASAKLHSDSFDTELSPEELAASQASFDELRGQLDQARGVKNTTPWYLRMTGLACCAIGTVLVVIARGNEESD